MAFVIDNFMKRLGAYEKHFTPYKLIGKLKRFGRKVGLKAVNAALVLYYASLDKGLPAKKRLMIIAALGYFILPADLIPDMLPFGFSDDIAALAFVLKTIWNNITPEVFEKAKRKLTEWFGPADDEEISIKGLIEAHLPE